MRTRFLVRLNAGRETGKNGSKKEVEQFIASQRHGVTSEVALFAGKLCKTSLSFLLQKGGKKKFRRYKAQERFVKDYCYSVELWK